MGFLDGTPVIDFYPEIAELWSGPPAMTSDEPTEEPSNQERERDERARACERERHARAARTLTVRWRHAGARAADRGQSRDIPALVENLAFAGRMRPGHDLDHGAFATTVFAQQVVYLPGFK